MIGEMVARADEATSWIMSKRHLHNMGLRFCHLTIRRGSNMMSIADLLDDKSLDSDIALVAADKPCAGLAFASDRDFQTRANQTVKKSWHR